MAISTYAGLQSRVRAPFQRVTNAKTMGTTIFGRMMSHWALAAGAGAAPTTGLAPVRTTVGALGQFNSSGVQRILGAAVAPITSQATLVICDRLSHQGGLSGTVAPGAQTTNLPTTALTRQTSGVGVMAALEIYTAVGATGTTVAMSYTNQAGTAGQTSIATVFGGTGFRELGRLILMPLAAGDTGVRAVASVTLAASTLTAGNFGVTLFRPLFVLSAPINPDTSFVYDLLNSGALAPVVDADACLFVASFHSGNNQTYLHDLLLGED